MGKWKSRSKARVNIDGTEAREGLGQETGPTGELRVHQPSLTRTALGMIRSLSLE